MNKQTKIIGALLGAALATASGVAVAESTYGYDAAGATNVSATAKVKVKVTVPKLLLLRVGADDTSVDILTFSAALTGGVIPGGAAPTDGSSNPSAWNGSAPTFATPANQNLTAYLWTNSSGGATLTLSSATDTALGSIAPTDILVTPTALVGAMPVHPANTGTGSFPTNAARNTLHTATWGYSISGSALTAAPAGVYEQTTTYTATTL